MPLVVECPTRGAEYELDAGAVRRGTRRVAGCPACGTKEAADWGPESAGEGGTTRLATTCWVFRTFGEDAWRRCVV